MLNQQGVAVQPLEIDDFSGGMTDNILGAPVNKYEKGDNIYLQKIGGKAKPLTRPAVRAHTNTRLSTNTRINSLFDIETKLFQISNKKIFQNDTTSFTEVTGPTNSAFNLGNSSSKYSVSTWQKHAIIANDAFSKIVRLYKNATVWTVNNLGLPDLTGTPTFLASSVGATYSYGYAFHYFTEYNNQGVTFEEQGSIDFFTATSNAALGGGNTITITAPAGWTITNGSTDNYLLSSLKIKVYRTTNGGFTYYYHSTQNYNFASLVDSIADTTINLASNEVLYTNGADDVPMHEQPPEAKVSHVVNDILCLGYVKEGSEYIPNRGRFSNRFSLWSCPSEFYEDFDEEIVGINSFNIYPIYFCKNKVYRIEGYFLPDGSGGVTKKLISSTAGCASNSSIIKTDIGLFWAGSNDGFYFTNGYDVTRISNDLLSSYLSLVDTEAKRAAITGAYYPKLQTVKWAVKSSSYTSDNDKLYVTYLQAGVTDNMPFTTWSGGESLTNFLPTSVHHTGGVLYMGDYYGYLHKFDHDVYSDQRIDTASAVDNWINRTIIYDIRSVAFDFGQPSTKKWVPKVLVTLENTSSVSLQIKSNNDNSGVLKNLKEIANRGNVAWGDYSVEWGDETLRWNYSPVFTEKRAFPKDGLRCFYKQIIFTNSYTVIDDSANLGTATFSGAANTVTLSGAKDWPIDSIDYYVSLASDNYVNQYRITERTDKVLTVEDITNVLPSGTYAWKIQGYRRDEVVRLVSYTIDYALTSQSASVYRA